MKTILLEKGLIGGQIAISKEVENYPGIQDITGFDLAEKLIHHAQHFGLAVIQQEVTEVIAGEDLHSVRLVNGEILSAIALILATGGLTKKLGVPGEAEYRGSGVSYCGACDGFFFRGKTVAVIGGGDTAVEEALYLSKLASKVYLIYKEGSLRATKILQNRLMDEPVIEIVKNTIISEIRGNEGVVNAVAFKNTKTGQPGELQVDGVFIFVGYAPNNQLIPSSIKMNERGFVITDEKCQTDIPGIFAVGDLRQKYANQIVVAAADGCIAALASAHYVESRKESVILNK